MTAGIPWLAAAGLPRRDAARSAPALAAVPDSGPSSAREAWLQASVDVRAQLLRAEDGAAPVLRAVLDHIRSLTLARTVTFVGPSRVHESHFEVRMATGAGAADLMGNTYEKTGTLEGRAMQENRGFLSTAATSYCHHLHTGSEGPAGPLLAVPLEGAEGMRGAIVASRGAGQPAFTEFELAMTQDFGRQSSIALRLVQSQATSEQLRFHEQRDGEVRRLHDDLIQQLFGLGITLESLRPAPGTAGGPAADSAGACWDEAAAQIDAIIARLRATLTTSPEPED